MRFLLVLFIAFLSVPSFSQTCNSFMKPSAESGRFVNLETGYVLDVVTMLRWSFCSLGQTYEQGTCIGTPDIYETFRDALVAASEVEGHRIPNIKELGTIVERSCVEPAINQSIFPDTPLYVYWSSTPGLSGSGMIIDFTDGSEIIRDINRPKVIRLLAE
jgi:hypothetical protein